MSERYGYCPKTMGLVDEPRAAEDLESHGESDVLREAAPSARSRVLRDADQLIHGPRRQAYGEPTENFARIAAGWREIVGVPISHRQIALMMTWLKIARDIESPSRDNLVDGAGYLALAEDV